MPFTPFHYSRSWQNPADYPTRQTSEEQNRADLQGSFTEWETYWNNVFLPALEAAVLSGGGSGGGGHDSGGPYLPLAGGNMLGPLRLYREPQIAMEATPKIYVDEAASNAVADANDHIAALELEAQRIAAIVANALDEEAVLEILANRITLSVTTRTDGDNVYARITLGIGPNNLYGEIKLDGNVTINGELSAEALYALYGEIANLAVNRLVTSRRIVKYLAGDTTDDNFIRIHGQFQEFVCASATGESEQARNPNGALLYWPMDVSELPLGGDGYPLCEGSRVYTVTRETEYPVMVYTYAEAVKRSTHFELDDDGTTYIPIDTFGAGNSQGTNIAHIVKRATSFDMLYTTAAGKVIGMRMRNDGYVDIAGLRRPSQLDFSQWEEGKFTELLEGSSLAREYSVTFDRLSRPVTITAPSGHVTNITW